MCAQIGEMSIARRGYGLGSMSVCLTILRMRETKMTDNSMMEKPRVRRGQREEGSRLHCFKPRDLASSEVGTWTSHGDCHVSEGATGYVNRPCPVGPSTLPAPDKGVKDPNGNPNHRQSTHISNWGLPKPASHGHGNGGPIVVRSVNGRISCEGAQMNNLETSWRCASARG